ncbi:MAG: alcohol dehydrogenase catalytic domain-containing protein [Dehalococcoidia bacterium]
MRAVTFQGANQVQVEDVAKPTIQAPEDAIVRVTTSSICGSDLHLYHGRLPVAMKGFVLGHEFAGVVEEVGPGVAELKPGARVVSAFSTSCGRCYYCRRRLPTQCLRGQTFGFGQLAGGQAEYVRIPFADSTCERIPDGLDDGQVILVGDVLATGYYCAEIGGVRPGDVVLVLGCGPVGLCTIICAYLLGAATVLAVDSVRERLALAERLGAAPIDMSQEDPGARVRQHSGGRGADVVCEAVGSLEALRSCFTYVRPGGTIAAVGVYSEPSFDFPIFLAFLRDLSFRTGICPAKNYMAPLIALIWAGRIDTTPLITHTLPLDEAAHAYEIFAHRQDGCIKVLLKS